MGGNSFWRVGTNFVPTQYTEGVSAWAVRAGNGAAVGSPSTSPLRGQKRAHPAWLLQADLLFDNCDILSVFMINMMQPPLLEKFE